MSSLAEILSPEVLHTAQCGAGRFTIDEYDIITQYDHTGRVVGLFRASDTPHLCAWIAERSPLNTRRGIIAPLPERRINPRTK